MPATAEIRTVAVGGQRLRVAITRGPNEPGQPPRLPLLLINGIGASLEALEPFVAALGPSLEVIRFDPPGIGGSPLPPGPYRYDRVDVPGISWGGAPGAGGGRFPRRALR